MIDASSVSLQVTAQDQNNLSATVSQQTIGGIESNAGAADAICRQLHGPLFDPGRDRHQMRA